MNRLLGSGMIILALVIYLYEERHRINQHNQMIADSLAAVESMETAVRWEKSTLPDTIQEQGHRKYIGEYFQEICMQLQNGIPLQEAWETVLSRIKPARISQILCVISLSGDSVALKQQFSCAFDEIKTFQAQERERQAAGQKLKRATAISAAAVLIILLL